jgi:YVTN family beta-propeller protein
MAVVGVAVLLGSGGLLTASAASPATGSVLVPIVPCRLFDTRNDGSSLAAGAIRTQAVEGANGDCVIPAEAVGVSMNVTIVNPTAGSYLTVWPSDGDRPTASNLNWVAGQSPTPNAVMSALSSTGSISLFNLAGTVDVLVDVNGYYIPAATGAGLQGQQGPEGPQGAQGPQGPQGPSGGGASTRISDAQIALLKWYQDPARAATFPAGGNTPFGLAFDGTSVWVANNQSDSVSKVNPATGQAVNTALPAGSGPFEVAFDGTNIWVTDNLNGKVSKIVASTGTVVGAFNTSLVVPAAGSGPAGIAFDGTSIWVANSASGTVAKINPVTGGILAEFQTSAGIPGVIPADASPTGVAFDGVNIWVTNNLTGTVSKVDRGNSTFVEFETTTGQQSQPWGVAFDGTHIWVANGLTNSASKMDPTNGSILAEVITGGQVAQELAFDGRYIWVSNNSSGDVSKIDAESDTVTATMATGLDPQGIVFDGTNIWVANSGGPSLSRLLP